jgi:hypothetical protein
MFQIIFDSKVRYVALCRLDFKRKVAHFSVTTRTHGVFCLLVASLLLFFQLNERELL